MPIEALAKVISFSGFLEGKWTVDVAKMLEPTVGQMIATLGATAKVPMKISLDDQSDSQFLNEIAGTELALDKSKAKAEGKPDNIIEKMVEGRLSKFYQESCLMDQTYIKDPDKKISDLLTETIATLGENISINRFIRFAVGENPALTNGQE